MRLKNNEAGKDMGAGGLNSQPCFNALRMMEIVHQGKVISKLAMP